ncbi:hypothetical protein R6Q57_006572 [Mikania cordata]
MGKGWLLIYVVKGACLGTRGRQGASITPCVHQGFAISGCFLLMVLLKANFMFFSVNLVMRFSSETEGSYLLQLV